MNGAPRILLGVTGGIAAYKAAEIVRALVKEGAEVQVVLTQRAEEFVTPLTLATLSGRPVARTEFAPEPVAHDRPHRARRAGGTRSSSPPRPRTRSRASPAARPTTCSRPSTSRSRARSSSPRR